MIILLFVLSFIICSILICLVLMSVAKLFESNYSSLKCSKKVSKSTVNKLLVSGKNNEEILQKINFNIPRLKADFDLNKAKEVLSPLGVDFGHKFYVFEVTDNTSSLQLFEEFAMLKRLEREGTKLNIVVLTNCLPKKIYNIKYALANFDFCLSVVRIYDINDISLYQRAYLRMLNINYYCGTIISNNITKSTDYCYFVTGKERGTNFSHSTMQTKSGYVSKYVEDCCIREDTTYDYIKDIVTTRIDFSDAPKDCTISKFIPINVSNYFIISQSSNTICVKDFETQKVIYYTCNKPIFLDAKFNKKGIYFSYKLDTQYLYIFESKTELLVNNIFACESIFIKSATLINRLPKVKVESEDKDLDEVINFVLPSKILKRFFEDISRGKCQFRAFALMDENSFDRSILSSNLTTLISKFFDILKTKYGITFGQSGIYLSKNRTALLSSKITFRHKGQVYNFDIKNQGLEGDTFKLKGIEYTGINFVSFDKMLSPISLQM